jgi:hypothetical protein
MTQWGFALLIAYVVLGTTRMSWRNAGRAALLTTVAVLFMVFAGYGALH